MKITKLIAFLVLLASTAAAWSQTYITRPVSKLVTITNTATGGPTTYPILNFHVPSLVPGTPIQFQHTMFASGYYLNADAGFNYFANFGSTIANPQNMAACGVLSGTGHSLSSSFLGASSYSVIAGGLGNIITDASLGFIGGGTLNAVTVSEGAIVGGEDNDCGGTASFIGAGVQNLITSDSSVIVGGNQNECRGNTSFLGGGQQNFANGSSSTVAGGFLNQITSDFSFIGGGFSNRADAWTLSAIPRGYSVIGGGGGNRIATNGIAVNYGHGSFAPGYFSTIAGGGYNYISAPVATICGGGDNTNKSAGSFMGGGDLCLIDTNSTRSAQIGGFNNLIYNSQTSFEGGGLNNRLTNASQSVLVGGQYNTLTNSTFGFIGGGQSNNVSKDFGVISGGFSNRVSGYGSQAAGVQASARNDYSFVWNDGEPSGYSTSADRQYRVHAVGGIFLEGGKTYSTNGFIMTNSIADRSLDLVAQTNVFEDLVFPSVVLGPPGSGSLVGTSGQSSDQLALTLSAGPPNQHFFVTAQMPHTWNAGTTIFPHLHVESQTGNVNNLQFTVTYSVSDIGGTFPADSTATQQISVPAGNQWKHLLFNMPTNGISMTGKTGPSTVIRLKYTLIASSETLHIISFDIHFRYGGTPTAGLP